MTTPSASSTISTTAASTCCWAAWSCAARQGSRGYSWCPEKAEGPPASGPCKRGGSPLPPGSSSGVTWTGRWRRPWPPAGMRRRAFPLPRRTPCAPRWRRPVRPPVWWTAGPPSAPTTGRILSCCGRRPGRGSGAPCVCGTWMGRRPRGPTVKTARSSPGSGRHFPGPGGRTGGGPPWPRAFTWSLERNSSGPTCPLQRRRAAASATACGTRWAYCGTARWCPAVWTTRGTSPWETCMRRLWRRSCPVRGPRPSIRASPRGEAREALCRRCAFTRRFQ